MRFRTEIEIAKATPIGADERLVFLGSCFADNMGTRLSRYGFDSVVNPLGPLFNPASLADALTRAIDGKKFELSDLTLHNGVWHCLNAAARYNSTDAYELVNALNRDFSPLADAVTRGGCTLFATFGTAYVYTYNDTGDIVANCHKLAASAFQRRRLTAEEIVGTWHPLLERLKRHNIRTVFTVSPVRHVGDGLHANNLSKASLLLAIDELGVEYFPAYEIVCDDLRDYRFYGSDLKHPSEQAIDYIFEKFADTYFTATCLHTAEQRYAQYLRSAHRQHPTSL